MINYSLGAAYSFTASFKSTISPTLNPISCNSPGSICMNAWVDEYVVEEIDKPLIDSETHAYGCRLDLSLYPYIYFFNKFIYMNTLTTKIKTQDLSPMKEDL